MAPVKARISNCVVARTGERNGGLCGLTGAAASASALEAVASGVVADSRWQSIEDFALVLRNDGAESILAAFGAFSEIDLARLTGLSAQIRRAAGKAHYVDYSQAEQDCEILAENLKDRYGRREVRRFSYFPLPRGGLIVYGMLSYALDLPANATNPSATGGEPKVIVDDCAISGLRFKQVLENFPDPRIIFAPLYSHPDLRSALCERESRVIDCIGARDLSDLAPDLYAERYAEWHAEWSRRQGDEVYWTGQPEYLCFAWSEPETSFWNSATGKIEAGWRLVPRSRCLRSRSTGDVPRKNPDEAKPSPALQILSRFPGPIKPEEGVVYARLDDETVAVATSSGSECFQMEGVAADMWHALMEHGAVEPAVASLEGRYAIEPQHLENDMQKFVEELREKGLVAGC